MAELKLNILVELLQDTVTNPRIVFVFVYLKVFVEIANMQMDLFEL